MNRVRVQLFGPQALLVGARHLDVAVAAETATCADVLSSIRAAAPTLGSSLDSSRLAVNHEFAEPERRVATGDEVALIGMVSGG